MPGPGASNKGIRDAQRVVHLLGALMLGVYIYVPLTGVSLPHFVAVLVQFVVFPVIVATGMLMWQLPRLRKRLRDKARSGAARERSTG